MGLPILKEVRRHIRRPLMGDLTGRLLVNSTGRLVPCLAVDVSDDGLRIMVSEELAPGVDMILALEGCNLPLVVVWCKPDARSRKSHECGLRSTGNTNLERFFVSIGWLEENRTTEAWIHTLDFVNITEEGEE
jgi:hypothetical protein